MTFKYIYGFNIVWTLVHIELTLGLWAFYLNELIHILRIVVSCCPDGPGWNVE